MQNSKSWEWILLAAHNLNNIPMFQGVFLSHGHFCSYVYCANEMSAKIRMDSERETQRGRSRRHEKTIGKSSSKLVFELMHSPGKDGNVFKQLEHGSVQNMLHTRASHRVEHIAFDKCEGGLLLVAQLCIIHNMELRFSRNILDEPVLCGFPQRKLRIS